MLRNSCGNCYFTNLNRPSDLTIADFWGIERTGIDFNVDNKGVSLLLINTLKGKNLFAEIENRIEFIQTEVKNCLQHNLQFSSIIHPLREQFEEDYANRGFIYIGKKYGNLSFSYRLFQLLRSAKHKLFR